MTLDQIKEQFIRARVDGKPIDLKELAYQHGRSHAALRQAASKGEWTKLAIVACAEREQQRIANQNAALASLFAESIETEVQIRRRHAQLARVLQKTALRRLMATEPGELSVKLATEMLRAGIEAERSALGLGDAPPICEQQGQDSALREAVQVATEILAKHAPRLFNSPHQPPPQEADQERIDESGFHCNQLQSA